MSKVTRAIILLVAAAAVASAGAAANSGVLQAAGSRFFVGGKAVEPVHYKSGLQSFVQMSELFIIPSDLSDDRFLVLVRKPSRHLAMDRCGAGHEDFLALVRVHGDDVALLDKAPLQSCENSVDLDLPDATEADSIVSAVKLAGNQISFSVVAPTREGDVGAPEIRRYRLVSDKFVKQ